MFIKSLPRVIFKLMALSQKFIGKQYPATSYQIGFEKVKEFLIAVKADQEKFSTIVPPTFPVVFQHELLAAVLFDPELKLNLAKLVHGEQEFIFHKPIKVGDTITTTGKIEKIFQKGPHDFVVFATSSSNQVGEKVCDSIWTFVMRGGNDREFTAQEKLMMKIASFVPEKASSVKLKSQKLFELSKKAEKSINLKQAKQDLFYFEKFNDGEISYTVAIDPYMPQVYAGASGDFNIIHLDKDFAKSVGLGENILHGMATMALGANYASYSIDPKNIKRYRARFSAPVKPLDILCFKGKWSEDRKQLNFNAKNQEGSEVLGSATFEVLG